MSREEKTDPIDHVSLNFPAGHVLKDILEQGWILGKTLGAGGCAEIYSVLSESPNPWIVAGNLNADCTLRQAFPEPDVALAIKVELYDSPTSGPEVMFYSGHCRCEQIEGWKEKRKLKFLGLPKLISYGVDEFDGVEYGLVVMERFGNSLKQFWTENGKRLSAKTVVNLGIQIFDALEYIHDCGYVHNDVKASNILVDRKCCDRVYLVDFGLAYPYSKCDGTHKTVEPDSEWAHYGTLESTSRDAHLGRLTRRSDLEMLAYTMLQLSSGKLPWEAEAELDDYEAVESQKIKYLDDVPKLFDECYGDASPCPGLERLFDYVVMLGFEEIPNYDGCRESLLEALAKAGVENDGKLDLINVVGESSRSKRVADDSTEMTRDSKRTCEQLGDQSPSEQSAVPSVQPDRTLRSLSTNDESSASAQTKRLRFLSSRDLADKPAEDLPGIGPEARVELERAGFATARGILSMYVYYEKELEPFVAWLTDTARSIVRRDALNCHECLRVWGSTWGFWV